MPEDTIIKSKYKLLKPLTNQGGMSETYIAEDLINDSRVVIKFCKKEIDKNRFIREIKLLEKYKDSGFVIPILDLDEQHTPPFFIMEEASSDLSSLPPLSLSESRFYFFRMLDCVEFIHAQGTFHRDIKPENFLIYKEKIVISDFGLAKNLTSSNLTQLNAKGGTEFYAPPDFKINGGFQNPQKSDDIYSLGKTFYFLLTKQNPIRIDQHDLPNMLYEVIKKSTSDHREDRYKNCSEFKNALEKVYQDISTQSDVPTSENKEHEELLNYYENLRKKSPNYFVYYYNLGLAKNKLGRYKEAIDDFNKATKLNPKFVDAYNDQGVAKYKLCKYEEAIDDFDKAIELNPKFIGAYNNRGLTKNEINKHREAIDDFDKAIELNPNFSIPYNNRGLTKVKLGKYKEAINDFDKAIELNPKYVDAYKNRNLARYKLGNSK